MQVLNRHIWITPHHGEHLRQALWFERDIVVQQEQVLATRGGYRSLTLSHGIRWQDAHMADCQSSRQPVGLRLLHELLHVVSAISPEPAIAQPSQQGGTPAGQIGMQNLPPRVVGGEHATVAAEREPFAAAAAPSPYWTMLLSPFRAAASR